MDQADLRQWLERFEELMRRVSKHLKAVRFAPVDLDEYFWDMLREALLAAGATEDEIHRFAVFIMCWITDQLDPDDREGREQQCELIAFDLASTSSGDTERFGGSSAAHSRAR
jgi:hypothetical protein